MKYISLISDKDRMKKYQNMISPHCPTLINVVTSYSGSENSYNYCNNTCPKNVNCNDSCDQLLFSTPSIPTSQNPTHTPIVHPPIICTGLQNSINSYNGPRNSHDYYNKTCPNICPKNFECNSVCAKLLFNPPTDLPLQIPHPPTSEIPDTVINTLQKCANTITPGPVGCESKMVKCCIDSAGPRPDIQNQCEIYSQEYCDNHSFTNPTQIIEYKNDIKENFENSSSDSSQPHKTYIILIIILIIISSGIVVLLPMIGA